MIGRHFLSSLFLLLQWFCSVGNNPRLIVQITMQIFKSKNTKGICTWQRKWGSNDSIFLLTLSQTTRLRLFQTDRVWRQQFYFWWKWQKVLPTSRKHCGKRRNCSLRAISPFPTVFSKDLHCRQVRQRFVWEKVKGTKHFLERRNCWLPASCPVLFSKSWCFGHVKTRGCYTHIICKLPWPRDFLKVDILVEKYWIFLVLLITLGSKFV